MQVNVLIIEIFSSTGRIEHQEMFFQYCIIFIQSKEANHGIDLLMSRAD